MLTSWNKRTERRRALFNSYERKMLTSLLGLKMPSLPVSLSPIHIS